MAAFNDLIIGIAAGVGAWWVTKKAEEMPEAFRNLPPAIPVSTQARKPIGGPSLPAGGLAMDPIIKANTSGVRAWSRVALETLVDEAEKAAGLPFGLMGAIVLQESNWNPNAVNRVTMDYGLFQINSQHFGKVGFPRDIVDALNPEVSTAAAVRLLREGAVRWNRDWNRVISEYNGGPRAAATKPFRNQGYVDAVLDKWAESIA